MTCDMLFVLRRALLVLTVLLVGRAASAAGPTVDQCLDASERGQELRDAGKLSRAFERFSLCASSSCPGPVRTSCVSSQASVLASMPTIIVVARNDDDKDIVGARVVVDAGAEEEVSGRPTSIDPGPHTVTVTADGHERSVEKIVVNLGEKQRFVRVRLQRSPATAGRRPMPSTPPTPQPAAPPERPSSGVSPLAIGLGATALVGVGASLVLGLTAHDELSVLSDSPCAARRTCDQGVLDDLRTRFLLADVALGVAVVAAAAAAWAWLSAPAAPPPTSRRMRHDSPVL